ncbi:hypothetical protein K491DRAFT_778578 [Lophiostoma macrostomum CBS 122681]|uniref:Uncharacterized protein n=1 Tax=Lophiostoma macrostomum CBS 122681 TaxID=1314788 RepID=A0A6A6T9L9_9PLEO|nr:hypothetical protein K491DRAFT_778578 [Lophiostoma macrostomum CBS 122681]
MCSDVKNDSVSSDSMFILFGLPREIRDLVYAKAFALLNLPETIVLRRSRYHELTNMIEDETEASRIEQRKFPGIVPAFCYTNRQIYTESLPVFLRDLRVVIGSSETMRLFAHFLNRVPAQKAFCAVTHLTLEADVIILRTAETLGTYRCLSDQIELWFGNHFLDHCPGLRHVTLTYPSARFYDGKTMEELAEYILKMEDGVDDRLARLAKLPEPKLCEKETVIRELAPTSLFHLARLESVTLVCVGGNTFTRDHGLAAQQLFKPLVDWLNEERTKRGVNWEFNIVYKEDDIELEKGLPGHMGWGTE